MTVDSGLRPATMSCSIWRDTPKAFAAVLTDRPEYGRMASLIISPGWMGGSPFFLSIASSLMVVFKIDIRRVFHSTNRAPTPIPCSADTGKISRTPGSVFPPDIVPPVYLVAGCQPAAGDRYRDRVLRPGGAPGRPPARAAGLAVFGGSGAE